MDTKYITFKEYAARHKKVCQILNEIQYDALFIAGGTNLNYFCGIEIGYSDRMSGMLLEANGKIQFICPKFEEERMKELMPFESEIFTWKEHENPAQLLKKILKVSTNKIMVDNDMPLWQLTLLQENLPVIKFVNAALLIQRCRSIKSAVELFLMRTANQHTVAVFSEVLKNLKIGITNTEVARLISELFKQRGINGGAFVLFGEAAAYPHGTKYPQILKEGDIVLMDGGCRVEGYFSDITRSVIFGSPNKKQLKVWNAVAQAQLEVIKIAKPGVSCSKLDEVARSVIQNFGFAGEYSVFSHRLGHGIGLNGHEYPYLVKDNMLELQAGMTFSNEPGIYIIGEIGVRLEDCFYITDNSSEFFTKPQPSIFSI